MLSRTIQATRVVRLIRLVAFSRSAWVTPTQAGAAFSTQPAWRSAASTSQLEPSPAFASQANFTAILHGAPPASSAIPATTIGAPPDPPPAPSSEPPVADAAFFETLHASLLANAEQLHALATKSKSKTARNRRLRRTHALRQTAAAVRAFLDAPEPSPAAESGAWLLEAGFLQARLRQYDAAEGSVQQEAHFWQVFEWVEAQAEAALAQAAAAPAATGNSSSAAAPAPAPALAERKRAFIARALFVDTPDSPQVNPVVEHWHFRHLAELYRLWAAGGPSGDEGTEADVRDGQDRAKRAKVPARRRRREELAREAQARAEQLMAAGGSGSDAPGEGEGEVHATAPHSPPTSAPVATSDFMKRTTPTSGTSKGGQETPPDSLGAKLARRRASSNVSEADLGGAATLGPINMSPVATRDPPPHLQPSTPPPSPAHPDPPSDPPNDAAPSASEAARWERERVQLHGWRHKLRRTIENPELDEETCEGHRDMIKWIEPRLQHAQAAAHGERPLRFELGGERMQLVVEAKEEEVRPGRQASDGRMAPSAKLVKPSARSTYPPMSTYSDVISALETPFSTLPPKDAQPPVASLAYGLDRVLFNPGVAVVRDPRSGVYNFPPELEQLPSLDEFAFDKLPQYITSSKDAALKGLAKEGGKLFVGSTSSVVSLLCQISIWLGKGRELNTSMLSEAYREQSKELSMGQQLPASVVLHYNDGRYSIDADKSFDPANGSNVLAQYGHLMEKFLTTQWEQFKRFLKSSADPAPSEAGDKQAYHYSQTEHMVLRSQLDCTNPHLPNQTFDLKTRATIAIRQDRANFEQSASYALSQQHGLWNSYEREYYDLIRSAFMKYSFQARIGAMDGILVAYHSTAEFFGFQYIPIEEMDVALFGNHDTGKQNFAMSTAVLERVLLEAKECYKECSLEVSFQADVKEDVLRVFVAPHRPQITGADEATGDEPASAEMTLIEVLGTNYVDGAPTGAVTVKSAKGEAQHWQLGYRFARHDGGPLSALGADAIESAFGRMRQTQLMFNEITLPAGVTRADLARSEREAGEAELAERAAEKFVGGEGGVGEVASDLDGAEAEQAEGGVPLHVQFPRVEGLVYSDRPRRLQQTTRRMASQGKRDKEARLKREEEEGRKIVEIKTEFVVRE